MSLSFIEAKLIDAGVKNLREFSYPTCTKENILTDPIFSRFYLEMLKENRGKMGVEVDAVIDRLRSRIVREDAGTP
jgi:hypothetical protein